MANKTTLPTVSTVYVPPVSRPVLIQQLREALRLAENPHEELLMFMIGDYEFEFDFSEDSS